MSSATSTAGATAGGGDVDASKLSSLSSSSEVDDHDGNDDGTDPAEDGHTGQQAGGASGSGGVDRGDGGGGGGRLGRGGSEGGMEQTGGGEEDEEGVLARLEELEEELSFEDIIIFRAMAEREEALARAGSNNKGPRGRSNGRGGAGNRWGIGGWVRRGWIGVSVSGRRAGWDWGGVFERDI